MFLRYFSYGFFLLGVQRANFKAISNAAKIQKFTILPKDFSIVGGEFGSTFKLKRSAVLVMYTEIIEKMYTDDNTV
jgi:long-chain-fatty-acid--CoA ligase ACSBG